MINTRDEFNKLKRSYRKKLPNSCFNCGENNDLTLHHIVPLALGGTNMITNISVLCGKCHGKVHGLNWINHSQATKIGKRKAKEMGRFGGRPESTKDTINKALSMYDSMDYTVSEILNEVGISKTTLYKYVRKREEKAQEVKK